MPFIETDDRTSLHYKDWGAGQTVVFVHGWSLSADIWEYQMVHLADHDARCIAYDRRGHGRSSQPGRGYDYDTLADDLSALIEQLDLRGITLVGHSMGGGEVARYLSRHGSQRVARVMLVAPVLPFLAKAADNPLGVDRAIFDDMVRALVADRPRYLAAGAPGFFGTGTVSPEMVQWALGLTLQTSLKAAIGCIHAFSETDFRPDLRAFTMPTLLVHGTADQSVPIDLTSRVLARAIPGCRLETYEGAPHGLFLTDKERFNRDLLAFLRG